MIVRELMLELLSYEPFEKFLQVEKIYIDNILSGNYQQPQSMLHDLFSGFHCRVQQEAFNDVDWLRQWKAAYGRAHLPLLFKKICFYLMVKGTLSGSDFMKRIGLQVTRFRTWKISPQFRRYAEADTYSAIKLFRNGVKQKYIVSTVKQLYYEAGRQASESKAKSKIQSMTLKKLPRFVDVFAGTATVAASMVGRGSKVPKGCPAPVVNDADPLMICFIWAFTYYQKELRSRLAQFINSVMTEDFNHINLNYTESEYENHYGFMDSLMRLKPDEYWGDKSKKFWEKELLTNPQIWDNFVIQLRYSKSYIAKAKKKAQRHKEFIIRIRSWYVAVDEYLKHCRTTLENMDFSALLKNMNNNQVNDNQVDNILDYALAVFYYYSFKPRGKSVFHVTCVDEDNYYSFLKRLSITLDAIDGQDRAEKAKLLSKLRLHPASLNLKYIGDFSGHLQNAKFYSQDFRSILPNGPSDRVYYLDSPYFLTTGYNVRFSDKDHKEMLDILRSAKWRWIFSMQYNPSDRDWLTGKKTRKGQKHIIENYGNYYRGFYAPLQLDGDQKYIPTDAPKRTASKLFVILFDADAAKRKKQKIYSRTIEMLVVNFDCLRTIPLHDTAVVLPFKLFLQCADAGKAYKEIVQRAITWREEHITKNYMGGLAV